MITKYYTIFNKQTGEILRSGSGTPEMFAHAVENLSIDQDIVELQADPQLDLIEPATKTVLVGQRPQPQKTYQDSRLQAYPSVQEQMDMLWHAMDQNQIPRAEPFYSTIKAIKQAIPKDNSVDSGTVFVHTVEPTP